MSIKSASILVDGTVATTGGTATSFKDKGGDLVSWRSILDDGSEFLSQTQVEFSIRDPKPNSGSPNGYSQARSSVVIQKPLLLDNGEYTVNTVRLTLSVDHETTDAEIQNLLVTTAQLLVDSDYADFWKKQSLG